MLSSPKVKDGRATLCDHTGAWRWLVCFERTRKVKIAVLHSFYSNKQPSGENNVVLDQVEALRSAGHEVLLISKSTDDQVKNKLNTVESAIRVATGRDYYPTALLDEFRPDVVHSHNLFPNLGSSWLKSWGGPLVVSVHNYRAVCSNGMLFRDSKICTQCPTEGNHHAVKYGCYRNSRMWTIPLAISRNQYQKDVLQRADAVVLTSEGSSVVLQQLSHVNFRSVLIPNFGAGPSVSPIKSDTRDANGWVALGRMSPEKGLLELVQSWPSGAKLTVIGDGPQDQMIMRAAEGKQITVLSAVGRDELRRMLPTFIGLVFPSRWLEVAPQVVVEAMRVGLPVVADRANVVGAFVEAGGAGESYSNGRELAQVLSLVHERLFDYSCAATKYYDENWLPEKWIAKMEDLYVRLIRERHS